MLLRNLKAVNFSYLREADVRNVPRRCVVAVEGPAPCGAEVFRRLLSFALYGPDPPDEVVIRPGAAFSYVEAVFLHPEAGPVTVFRGTDRRRSVQVSVREPDRRQILSREEEVRTRLGELVPQSRADFTRIYLGGEIGASVEAPAPPIVVRLPEGPGAELSPGPEAEVDQEFGEIRSDGEDGRRLRIHAVVFTGMAVLLFTLLFAARRVFSLEAGWVSVAQFIAGGLVLLDVGYALWAWRRREDDRGGTVKAPAARPDSPRPVEPSARAPGPEAPAAEPRAVEKSLLTPEMVREAGSRALEVSPRFLVLDGDWPGDAEELLRAAGLAVSQVFLLTGPGGAPPGCDLKLAIRDRGADGLCLGAVV